MAEIKNYITPLGFKRLCDERDFLLKIDRPRVTKIVAWAASLGDRSENADYQYGKKRLREIDRRLRFLGGRIEAALVVDPALIKASKVQFGATVKLEDEEGEQRIFTIVGVDEIDTQKGLISWQSPITKSLLGKEEGDSVRVRTPASEKEYEIINVEYQAVAIAVFVAPEAQEVFRQ